MRGKAKLLTDKDINNCLRYIQTTKTKERTKAMFILMLTTALRIHSIQKLTIGQVYDEHFKPRESFLIQPNQNKGGRKSLQVYINDTLNKELVAYMHFLKSVKHKISPEQYLFMSNKGSYLSKQQIIRIITSIFKAVGLDSQYRCHSLRATALTRLMDANYPLTLIQQISGHSSIQTLSIYYRSNPKNIKNALETLSY